MFKRWKTSFGARPFPVKNWKYLFARRETNFFFSFLSLLKARERENETTTTNDGGRKRKRERELSSAAAAVVVVCAKCCVSCVVVPVRFSSEDNAPERDKSL
jgi:hypothetical protein